MMPQYPWHRGQRALTRNMDLSVNRSVYKMMTIGKYVHQMAHITTLYPVYVAIRNVFGVGIDDIY